MPSSPTSIPLEDRLPTFAELDGFDAGAAWDRLTPPQQREIGALAIRFGTVGQCHGYSHQTLDEVRAGFATAHWTPAAQATAVWPAEQIEKIERAAEAACNDLTEHFDPLWPTLFNWVKP